MDAGFERVEYDVAGLDESDVDADAIEQFARWFDAASHLEESNIMVLATVGPDGQPSNRAVLLKSFDERGFVFFTNLNSEKGQNMAQNPQVEACFLWQPLHRQIRIRGSVEPIDPGDSDAYWRSRPRDSQIASAASPQSSVLRSRAALQELIDSAVSRWAGVDHIPRPEHWGGLRIVPTAIEFWQGQASRAHDRLRYRRVRDGWLLERLAP